MMYRKPSRDPSQVTKSDSRRPLLSPLFTHFSSPETKFTQSPGSIDNISSRPRTKHLDRNTDGVPIDEGSDEDHGSRSDGGDNDRGELGRLAKGIDGIGKAYDTRMHSDFMKHANESLHSLISRRGTLLEHSAVDSGPPTSSGQHPQGHIFASNTTSANDYADIDVLKPPRNAHDEYLSQQRRLFPSPAEQARKNDEIIGNMHNWMDELLQMQEGIAELHMKLEGVEGEDGDDEFELKDKLGTEDVLGKREQEEARSKDGEKAAGSEKGKQQEEEEEKREDEIMNEMIQQVSDLLSDAWNHLRRTWTDVCIILSCTSCLGNFSNFMQLPIQRSPFPRHGQALWQRTRHQRRPAPATIRTRTGLPWTVRRKRMAKVFLRLFKHRWKRMIPQTTLLPQLGKDSSPPALPITNHDNS